MKFNSKVFAVGQIYKMYFLVWMKLLKFSGHFFWYVHTSRDAIVELVELCNMAKNGSLLLQSFLS